MTSAKNRLTPRPTRTLPVLLLCLAASLCLYACAGAAKQKPEAGETGYLDQVQEFVERGRYAAALALVDARIQREPDNYEQYLLRATVFTTMHQDDKALADLDYALAVFDRTKRNFPPKEHNPRLAGIHKDYALACYLAERRAEGPAAQKYRELFTVHAGLVKSLDEPTYLDLTAMIGKALDAQPAGQPQAAPSAAPGATPAE
jgi:tetratricopeptide (TPR) repeat protein